jgi:hypothetical protein
MEGQSQFSGKVFTRQPPWQKGKTSPVHRSTLSLASRWTNMSRSQDAPPPIAGLQRYRGGGGRDNGVHPPSDQPKFLYFTSHSCLETDTLLETSQKYSLELSQSLPPKNRHTTRAIGSLIQMCCHQFGCINWAFIVGYLVKWITFILISAKLRFFFPHALLLGEVQ